MTNLSKSANCSISDAIDVVKELGDAMVGHARFTSNSSHRIVEALEHASTAIENICLCLKQHEDRIKELEAQ